MGDFNRDWTLVQRRGRRRPARPPFHDRGGGWMESAPTVPYRGRTNFRSPNPNPNLGPKLNPNF